MSSQALSSRAGIVPREPSLRPDAPGRVCPLRYRHGPGAISRAPERRADTLYVIGGLYGNLPALDAIDQMAAAEAGAGRPAPALCFNGDFNWFDVDDARFDELNRRVMRHDALLGNVEAEFGSAQADAGCGCAYPAHVDAVVVERSNRIHARLAATAARHPAYLRRTAGLPMVARYRVAGCRVGVVHGDADSLAGWRFDASALDAPGSAAWLQVMFDAAAVDAFASTHTCLPALRRVAAGARGARCIVNNGAAGRPNFAGEISGLCTRVGGTPSPHPALGETRVAGAFVALLPVRYDAARWQREFLSQWPAGSDAWRSYFERIVHGPDHSVQRALGAPLR